MPGQGDLHRSACHSLAIFWQAVATVPANQSRQSAEILGKVFLHKSFTHFLTQDR